MRFFNNLLVIAVLILLFLAPFGTQSFAVDSAAVREKAVQLEQLRKRISRLNDELKDVHGSRDAQQQALEKTDKAISAIAADLRQTRLQITAARKQLSDLEDERRAEQRKLADMRVLLEKEIRASYMAGRQERVKLLLNQEDPASVGRMLVYQGYFARARTRRMQTYNDTLSRLEVIQRTLYERQAELESLHGEQQTQSEKLAAEQVRQRDVLAGINKHLGDKSAELKTLEQDEQRLSQLMQSLQHALQDIPLGELDQPMDTLKGKLEWPVAGRISRRYGVRRAVGKPRSHGVYIATRPDMDVRAVAKGRVAFADWFRGFGLLLIIEHGDGYMSLYGRNNSLYKGVGEWVERGEVVAAAGSSGGHPQSGLYLELRKDGRPLDPGVWFRGQPVSLVSGG